MKRDDPRIQKIVLRILSIVALPVLPAIFSPHFGVEKFSWLVGFRQPPNVPLLYYFGAAGSFLYLALSAIMWMISCDVARYRPLGRFMGCICLIASVAYWWITSRTGMPTWLLAADTLSCLIGGAALLWAFPRERIPD